MLFPSAPRVNFNPYKDNENRTKRKLFQTQALDEADGRYRAGGVEDHRWTAPLKPELVQELRRLTGASPSYEHYGLCGGAIVRVAALRDSPDITGAELSRLSAMDDRVGKWNDVTLAVLLMAGGHTVAPWGDLKQGDHPPHRTAFAHNDKRWYGKALEGEREKGMCSPPPASA